ncbi:hypothetical protein KVT40_003900 [Elsinoe batatas]|uniref:Apple domain-containing protein n=1 Tax=Elsinoe batatas TaxID=2601811 RepID=A0A8K0L2Q8_9PEZI|nr:hypothetical protein KVT40_003900 [Elsinoe batatas]
MQLLKTVLSLLGLLEVAAGQTASPTGQDIFAAPSITHGKGPPGGIPGATRPPAAKKTNSKVFASSVVSSLRSVKSREKAARTSTAKGKATTARTTVKTTTKKNQKKKTTTTTTTKKKKKTAKKTTTPAKKTKAAAKTTSAPTTKKQNVKAASSTKKANRRHEGRAVPADVVRSEEQRLEPRQNAKCSEPELNLLNYIPPVNTPNGFLLDAWMGNTAAANYIAPAGYYTAFYSQMAALYSKSQSLGYTQLATYDTAACAAICDARSDCAGFNIYFERNPLHKPNENTCPNPASRGSVACVPYGGMISAAEAVNFGQWRNDFMVLITGSNGYIKTPLPDTIQDFRTPKPLVGAVNAYTSSNVISYQITASYAPGDCAKLCKQTTAAKRAKAIANKASSYTPCNYFNTFNLAKNAWNYRYTYCVLYSDSNVADQAGYLNAASINNEVLNVTYSHGWSLYPPDKGLTSRTWAAAPTGTAASCKSMASQYGSSLTSMNDRVYTFACNYDVHYSSDIGNITSPDFYSCFELCDAFDGCSGFAYLGTTCYFKNLDGSSRTPQPNTWNADMAWIPAKYDGFDASKVPGTATWGPTITKVWTGASTVTTTSFECRELCAGEADVGEWWWRGEFGI